jgi:hypothetical protein
MTEECNDEFNIYVTKLVMGGIMFTLKNINNLHLPESYCYSGAPPTVFNIVERVKRGEIDEYGNEKN